MRKLLFLTFALCFFYIGSKGQNSSTPVQITKAELTFFKDIKPILARAYPDKDYSFYDILNFDITVSLIEGGNAVSFSESNTCGKFTEKQRLLIEKYGKPGMVFTLERITVKERGKPGTPYNPEAQKIISVPNILFSVKE